MEIEKKYCPCGNKKIYTECCGRFIDGTAFPATPEELMRSRYTAYSLGQIDYIEKTMRPPASDHFDAVREKSLVRDTHWDHLTVMNSSFDSNKGYVEFIATYSADGKKNTLHEISEFHFDDGKWYYVDGKQGINPSVKIGRNDPCPCGSQKKYKKCCGL
jgi:SEC-C motif-containing protein